MQRVSHNLKGARCKYMQSEILIQDRNCKTVTVCVTVCYSVTVVSLMIASCVKLE